MEECFVVVLAGLLVYAAVWFISEIWISIDEARITDRDKAAQR